MKPELEQQLFAAYPEYFRDLYGDPMKTCMAFGICVADGWYDLIERVCREIKEKKPAKRFKFTQVKEKFGGLRIYSTGGRKEIYEIIGKAQDESFGICEQCGTTEGVTTEGKHWIISVCKSCREELAKPPKTPSQSVGEMMSRALKAQGKKSRRAPPYKPTGF